MPAWIVMISSEFPTHWPAARDDGWWDVREPERFRAIAPGDDIFFWLGGRNDSARMQGWGRATSTLHPLTTDSPRAHWENIDTGGYKERFHFTVISSRRITNPSWTDLKKRMHLGAAQSPVQHITDPDAIMYLRSLFAEAAAPRADLTYPSAANMQLVGTEPYRPTPDEDDRAYAHRAIVTRRGQDKFRRQLLAAYKGRCAITGSTVESVLEAAHIDSYKGDHTNNVVNGLLLRADVHTLFDLFAVAIDEEFKVRLCPALEGTEYAQYEGQPINVPNDPQLAPSLDALARHRQECGWIVSGQTTGE